MGFELGEKIKTGGLVLLYGGLGAGKTTFIQGLAKGLGIRRRVISPTFMIARRYKYHKSYFFHIDLYRLTDRKEVKDIGIEEIWSKNNVVVIEWPELVEQIAPKHVKVKLKTINQNDREIEIIY